MRYGIFAIGAFVLLSIAVPQVGKAYTFTLHQQFPDIFADFLTVTYTASGGGSGTLTASGFASTLTVPPTDPISGTTTYTLTANINAEALQSGTLTIDGKVAALGYNSGTLLTGTLTGLSVGDNSNIAYVTFTPTGGDAYTSGLFVKSGGIILNLATVTPPSSAATFFASSFSSAGNTGVSDNFSTIPEPVTGVLTLMGLATCALASRRRGQRS